MITSNLRTVRSFVRREGRMTHGQTHAIETGWAHYGIEFDQKKFDPDQMYLNRAPWVVEIGFGNGQHLASMAVENREKNYLGIEVYRPGIGSLLITAARFGLSNLKVSQQDAVVVMNAAIPNNALAEIYIICPDPWPKRRHHKRRLLQTAFVKRLYDCLASQGQLIIATDHANYAQHIQQLMHEFTAFKSRNCPSTTRDRITNTKYAQRGARLNHSLWIGVYTKDKIE